MIDAVAGVLALAGASLALLAAVGVLRMPDVFTRMQASTKAPTLGLGCLLGALLLLEPTADVLIRALTIAAFVMLTTPVSAHVIARAAARTGAPLWVGTLVDERPVELTDTADSVPHRHEEEGEFGGSQDVRGDAADQQA